MTDIVAIDRPLETFDEQAAPATRVRGYWRSVIYRLRHDPVTLFFAGIVLLIVLAAICAPLIAPFDPYKESVVGRLKPFGWRDHLLGSDELGRDLRGSGESQCSPNQCWPPPARRRFYSAVWAARRYRRRRPLPQMALRRCPTSWSRRLRK